MANKKILFAISDTGGGHRSGANAIIAALNASQNAEISCSVSDILRITQLPGLKKAPEIYDYCSKHHLWLNNLFFRKTNSIKRIKMLTKLVYMRARKSLIKELTAQDPDLVVSVHPLVTGLLAAARKSLRATWPIITVVTDLDTLHASWATPGADMYLAPTEEAYNRLRYYGVPQKRLIYSGFPVHPKFTACPYDQVEARQQLGIDLNRTTLMLTGGGVGAGKLHDWVLELEHSFPDCQLLVVTGNNKELYKDLTEKRTIVPNTHVLGFVNNMEVLMAASDLIVTKAGPGTLMEALVMRRPVIVTEAVGIQEEGNIDFVHNNHFGYSCSQPHKSPKLIAELLSDFRSTPAEKKFVPDNGSARIASLILNYLGYQVTPEEELPLPQDKNQITIGA